jgi:hypothetical protein
MKASTALSTVPLSLVVGHPPFASALVKADVRALLALKRHEGLMGLPNSAPTAAQSSSALTSLPAAASFAAWQVVAAGTAVLAKADPREASRIAAVTTRNRIDRSLMRIAPPGDRWDIFLSSRWVANGRWLGAGYSVSRTTASTAFSELIRSPGTQMDNAAR